MVKALKWLGHYLLEAYDSLFIQAPIPWLDASLTILKILASVMTAGFVFYAGIAKIGGVDVPPPFIVLVGALFIAVLSAAKEVRSLREAKTASTQVEQERMLAGTIAEYLDRLNEVEARMPIEKWKEQFLNLTAERVFLSAEAIVGRGAVTAVQILEVDDASGTARVVGRPGFYSRTLRRTDCSWQYHCEATSSVQRAIERATNPRPNEPCAVLVPNIGLFSTVADAEKRRVATGSGAPLTGSSFSYPVTIIHDGDDADSGSVRYVIDVLTFKPRKILSQHREVFGRQMLIYSTSLSGCVHRCKDAGTDGVRRRLKETNGEKDRQHDHGTEQNDQA